MKKEHLLSIIVFVFLSGNYISRYFPQIKDSKFYQIYSGCSSLLVLCCIIYLIITSLLRISSRNKKHIAFAIIPYLLVSLMLTGLFLVIVPSQFPTGSFRTKFDNEIWKMPSSTEWTTGISKREEMLGDLIKNVIPGKSKEEIVKLLGNSSETNYFRSIKKDFIFYLGPERDHFFNIDSEWLILFLNENGVYNSFTLLND